MGKSLIAEQVGMASLAAIVCASLVAWGTHFLWVISTLASDEGATAGQIVLGVIGAFMPPVGVIHGVMVWFGVGMG